MTQTTSRKSTDKSKARSSTDQNKAQDSKVQSSSAQSSSRTSKASGGSAEIKDTWIVAHWCHVCEVSTSTFTSTSWNLLYFHPCLYGAFGNPYNFANALGLLRCPAADLLSFLLQNRVPDGAYCPECGHEWCRHCVDII
ncbi:hypothetical protein BP5796_04763 [Coleophoma crateriformis]|uniref:Uncharacterized protein n=1 Tax=Coleophoma crateriformis TaxID=565419 RepID=A0A3D8SA79_9HELO|nr:hypothetical protein BP5796_04763 [Coleophoma crateriformis]